jgi:hypothetical protein
MGADVFERAFPGGIDGHDGKHLAMRRDLETLMATGQSAVSTTLHLINAADRSQFTFTPRKIVLAGYTGRDREAVQRHIDELLEQGIPAPEKTPELYWIDPSSILVDGSLPKSPGRSSGEVEFVLLLVDGTIFVGVGSDHTDRELEQTSIIDAKRSFSKIVSHEVWPLAALQRDWDALLLRSWVTDGNGRRKYQEGPLAAVMVPDDLLALVPDEERGDGLVLYSGTFPALEPAPTSGSCRFEGEIVAGDGRSLAICNYTYEA